MNVFEIDSCAGGKGTRRKHQTTLENIQPGRAPVGLRPDETLSSNTNAAELESNSECSDDLQEDTLQTLAASSRPQPPRSISYEILQPPSPNLIPLLTSRADTPMLGAQARAAELAAASAAKQRQVSRELEDRQLPPNSTVSLSAFTRPQPTTTRNKGNKAWKPLILDDIVETPDDASASDPTISTPSHTDRLTAKEASDKKIPTAPRAMVAGRTLATLVAFPQPPPAQPSPVTEGRASQGYEPAHPGGDPYPVFIPHMYLPQPFFAGGIPMNDAGPFPTYGSMMVPADMSPTKQEQKFSMLENVPLAHMMHGQDMNHFTGAHHGMMQHDDPFSHGPPPVFGHDHQYMWDPSNQDAYYHGYQVPYPQHMGGNFESGIDGGFTGPQLPPPSRLEPPVKRHAALPIRRAPGPNASSEPTARHREPYDTERAMKECVSKLKEKAKDGKTVLHNPDVQKEQTSGPGTEFSKILGVNPPVRSTNIPQAPVPWDVRPRDHAGDANEWEVMPPPADTVPSPFAHSADSDPDLRNIRPAPGLPPPRMLRSPHLASDHAKADSPDTPPHVGSAAWMHLAPITAAERNRVRRCMSIAAKSLTNHPPGDEIPSHHHHHHNSDDLLETQTWFHTDARGERLLREQVGLSAHAHAAQVVAGVRARHGGELPEEFTGGKHDGLAASLILGNVACNLQTYLVGDRKSVEQRRNFHKVANVPDWCTERGGGQGQGMGGGLGGGGGGGGDGGDSYFDGVAGGFYGAPVRVARDPRFRPQVKEGIKVKAEEEWKNRHEMYGRRMM